MNLVLFYAPPPPGIRDEITYFDQLEATLHFNKKIFSKILIFSTVTIQANIAHQVDCVVKINTPYSELTHLNRVLSWKEYSICDYFDQDSILADADIIFNSNFQDLFDNNFFSLCFLASPSNKTFSCINAGIILLKHSKKDDIYIIFSKIFRIAKKIKDIPDPRFPSFNNSGLWGLDELCLFNYITDLISNRHSYLRDYIESIDLTFPKLHKINDSTSLMHINYCIPTSYLKKITDFINYPSVHFAGANQKKELIKLFKSNLK